MTNELTLDLRRATTFSLALSVLMMITGAVALGVPVIAGFAVTGLFGWLLILTGVLHLALALNGQGVGWRLGCRSQRLTTHMVVVLPQLSTCGWTICPELMEGRRSRRSPQVLA